MFKKLTVLFIIFVFLAGCVGSQLNPANLKTPHARGRFVNVTYSMAFADYVRYSQLPDLKPSAIKLLNAKRKILIELADPIYGPLTVFNQHIQDGVLITDGMFNALLDRLLLLETGWYTESGQARVDKPTVFTLTPQSVNKQNPTQKDLEDVLKRFASEAGLTADLTPQMSEIMLGTLIELLRTGIHALRAMLQQRGWDEEQMAAGYAESYSNFKALDMTALKKL